MVNHSVSLSIIETQFAFTRMNCISCDSFSSSLYASLLTLPTMTSHTRLDSIGIGGFSHDFGSLNGNVSPVMTAFESFGSIKPSLSAMLSFLLGMVFPKLSIRMPNNRRKAIKSLVASTRGVAIELLDKATKEKADVNANEIDKSILGALREIFRFLQTMVPSGRITRFFSQIYKCELKSSHVGRRSDVSSASPYQKSQSFDLIEHLTP